MALFDGKSKDKAKEKEGKEKFANEPSVSGMNKQQLLELLIEQTREVESLQQENEKLAEQLAESRRTAAGYRNDLDHAFSLLRLTMRLENIVQKLDPSYIPEQYEQTVIDRLEQEIREELLSKEAECSEADQHEQEEEQEVEETASQEN